MAMNEWEKCIEEWADRWNAECKTSAELHTQLEACEQARTIQAEEAMVVLGQKLELQAQLAAALAGVERLKRGECIKCNMNPMRTACAYPEACEHPGLKLALLYNQSLLTTAGLNGTVMTLIAERDHLQQRCGALEEAVRVGLFLSNPTKHVKEYERWSTLVGEGLSQDFSEWFMTQALLPPPGAHGKETP